MQTAKPVLKRPMTMARWRAFIFSFITTGMGMRTTRKSLTRLMMLAARMCAASLMQAWGLKERVHWSEIGLGMSVSFFLVWLGLDDRW